MTKVFGWTTNEEDAEMRVKYLRDTAERKGYNIFWMKSKSGRYLIYVE